jgi:ankyrin repeat protein
MDVPEPDEEDVKAIIEAAETGNLEEVRRLVQQDRGLMDAASTTDTPLTAAALGGHVGVIRYLLEEGAQLGLRDPDGWTALDVACFRGHLGAVCVLLAHGADAVAPGTEARTPLMRASQEGHADVVALLLAHGCGDIDHQDDQNSGAALDFACDRGHTGVVRALLGAGADPHVEDCNGVTPLAVAVRLGREECVAELQVRHS